MEKPKKTILLTPRGKGGYIRGKEEVATESVCFLAKEEKEVKEGEAGNTNEK